MPQSHTCLYCHLVFSTKDRRPLITDALRDRLYEYLGGILRGEGCTLVEIGGTANHVHLLVSVSKERAVSEITRVLKTNSSRWVHQAFPDTFFAWQTGYAAFSIGHSGVERVRAYIRNQEEHHRTVTFEEEFRELLRRYEVAYDERYLWG